MIWQSALGLLVLPGLAWLISEARWTVRPRTVVIGLVSQLALALALLKLPGSRPLFLALNDAVLALQSATEAGTEFVFGYLGGGEPPFEVTNPQATYILAFQALPLVLVVSALSSLLFYWRVLPWLIRGVSWLLQRTLRVGGALGTGAAANVFVGMTESPLVIRGYLQDLTRSELFALMSCGMATIAGTMMVLYAQVVGRVIPDAMGHILTASLISVPAALMMAQIMVPERDTPTAGSEAPEQDATGSMDAITRGTLSGVQLLLNIVAMIVVLVALVELVNILLASALPSVGEGPITMERVLGWLMAPLVWLMGIPWAEAMTAGQLMGVKVVLNELVAYVRLAEAADGALSSRSEIIMTYAMCGFANLGSLGIMIGGLGTLIPERRSEVVALGPRSIVAGVLATSMTGAVVGLLGTG
jgi:CNT family concentrative nucleoside transporter